MNKQFKEHLLLEDRLQQRIKNILQKVTKEALQQYDDMEVYRPEQLLGDDNYILWLQGEFYKAFNDSYKECLILADKQVDDMIDIQLKQRKTEEITTTQPIANKSTPNLPSFHTPTTRIQRKSILRKPNRDAQQYMQNEAITLAQKQSQQTLQDIRDIITRGEQKGENARKTGQQIRKKLSNYKQYQAERIARTEITHSLNYTKYDKLMNDPLVDYFIWHAAHDSRTRPSHLSNDDEIVKKGEPFSNGQLYPGDKSVPVSEFVNCRCTLSPYIPRHDVAPPGRTRFKAHEMITTTKPTPTITISPTPSPRLTEAQLNNMTFQELAKHYGVNYDGLVTYDYDGKKYHRFTQEFPDSKFRIYFEQGAIKSYTKKGIATPNEIIQEVCRISNTEKQETNEVWFKNTLQGIMHRPTKNGYDTIGKNVGGYNAYHRIGANKGDVNHRIVINPKYFKGSKKNSSIWEQDPEKITDWRHALHHEFMHSLDLDRKTWNNAKSEFDRRCFSDEYTKIHQSEPYFTRYANTERWESYAEHGGYVTHMLEHPEEHGKKITLDLVEDGKRVRKDIDFKEYKEMYPLHYEYFRTLIEGG